MRADLVVRLVSAHFDARNDEFAEICREIADAERAKGNERVARQLLSLCGSSRASLQGASASLEPPQPYRPSPGVGPWKPMGSSPSKLAVESGLWTVEHPALSLDDLAAPPELRARLERIAEELRDQDKLRAWGVHHVMRGIFCGPPGTGKTLAARAIAGASGRPLFVLHLDAVLSSYLGETGKNLHAVFDEAIRAGALLFLDEVDALAKGRDDPHELGEMKRVVNTVLQNLDRTREVLPVIAATNHEDVLDHAVWRRFTDVLRFQIPTAQERTRIAELHLAPIPSDRREVTPDVVAMLTEGMSGAEVATLIRNAVRHAIVHHRAKLQRADLNAALQELWSNQRNRDAAPADADQILAIVALREKGLKQREIGERLGVSAATVNRRLKEWDSRRPA